ncbi:endolytic transglycosylase MltG [Williamsia soli]|uniref:endolytic transglycosylase MltG n=1 Tax=Williamsia soli TaxID=364929 RepID=UPI0027DAD14C|nr:endolytic transglycosylase MltG [Williamsia soli]
MNDDRSEGRPDDPGHGNRQEQQERAAHRRRRSDGHPDPERLRYFTHGDGAPRSGGRHGPRAIPPQDPGAPRRSPPRRQGDPPAAGSPWSPPGADEGRRPSPPATPPPPSAAPAPPAQGRGPVDSGPVQPPATPHESRLEHRLRPPHAYDPAPSHDAPGLFSDPGRNEYDRRQAGARERSSQAGAPVGATGRDAGPLPARDRSPKRSAAAERRRRRRRVVISIAVVFMVVLIGGIGYAGLRVVGFFGADDKDFTNTAGTADVIVQIPQDATLTKFGEILTENDVVASVNAFTTAAGGEPISAGFYKLRTEIPASTAVAMMTNTENRVGRVVIPEGLQLDTKEGIDGKTTPGIFARVAEATTVDLNGEESGVTVEELAQAAATATPQELGVPSWATDAVTALTGDHRRIEGLIAPTSWEAIDPSQTPVQMLNYLISRSASLFAQWGLPESGTSTSNLTPYQTLVTASVVEREVNRAEDYPKVARVIVNRLGVDQALQMDSTVNYTSAIQNIDVAGDDFTAATKWNTYQQKGLPPTPIGAVGQPALEASLDPPAGNWLYFVSVDQQGTTLFTEDFEQHKRNRQQACDNGVLKTNCG